MKPNLNGEYPAIPPFRAGSLPTGRQEGVQYKGNTLPESFAF
jgi:hypothetical protein